MSLSWRFLLGVVNERASMFAQSAPALKDRRHPRGILRRPMDFYAAFLTFFIGVYGFLDPNWPEQFGVGTPTYWILTIEDTYLMFASSMIMSALIMQQANRWLVTSVVLEMFGWLFVASAALVITLSSLWLPTSAIEAPNLAIQVAWTFVWAGLAAAAFSRWFVMRRHIKKYGGGSA